MLEPPGTGGNEMGSGEDGGRGVLILGLVLGVLGFIFQSPVLYAFAVAALVGALWTRVRRPARRT
jgi:hypothetical protein